MTGDYEPTFTGIKLTEAQAEAEKTTHKPASRAYFNLLSEFFPPEDTLEYWERLYEASRGALVETGEPKLLKRLVEALWLYMEDTVLENAPKDEPIN